MTTQTLIFCCLIAGLLTGLLALAATGSMIAVVFLSITGTILVFMAGAAVAVYVVRIMDSRAQRQFSDNAQENLGIMQQLQHIQNQQNAQLLKQVKQLPQPGPGNGGNGQPLFEIDEGVFEDLE